jgi:catechol 2,3-dioxygenase-like lactoylglutathione lyase family enzyme
MSDIEPYRKQAKLYLRWHRQGYYPVAATIRRLLGRFAPLSEAQILAHPFKLADAQELVASKHGFENWAALKKGIEPMSIPSGQQGPHSNVIHAEPQLFVADMARSLDFYVAKLGFEIAFSYGEPPFYAQVFRQGARLNLRHSIMPAFDPAFTKAEGDPLSATIALDDAKPLFLEYEGKSVDFQQRLRTEPWGARTFIVRDPDGNLICFAGPA